MSRLSLCLAWLLLGAPAFSQDGYDFQQRQALLQTLKFETALALWSKLDDSQRMSIYSAVAGGGQKAQSDFSAFRQNAAQKIERHEADIASLETQREEIEEEIEDRSTVAVGHSVSVLRGTLSASTVAVGQSESRILAETQKRSGELASIDAGVQSRESAIEAERRKVAASSARAAESAEQAANEMAYVTSLETALQNGYQPTMRFRELESLECEEPRFTGNISVTFDSPGRLVAYCTGKFKVTATLAGTSQVTGIRDSQAPYRRFIVIDASPGSTYAVQVQAQAPIRVVAEELRD